MAFALPTLDELFPGQFSAAPVKLRPKVAAPVAAPVDPETLLTPEEKKQLALYLQPRGALGEIGAGLARGATYELPRMIGQGLKATGQPGDVLYGAGEAVNKAVADNAVRFAADRNAGAHNAVTTAVAEGAAMLAPSLAPLALAPFTGGGSLGLAAAGAAGAGMFGASQYQDTYEKALKAGKTPEEAHQLGLQTGTVEGVGEGVGTVVGGAFLSGAGKVLPRVLGRRYGVDEALAGLRNPKFLPQFAKELGKVAAVETGTEMAQNYGEAAIEQSAGIDKQDPWDSATSAIGPTLALTALLAPFGGVALRRRQQRNSALIATAEDSTRPLTEINTAAGEVQQQLEPLVGKEAAAQWRLDALARTVQDKAARLEAETPAINAFVQGPAAVPVDQSTPFPWEPPAVPPQYAGGPVDAEMTWQALLAGRDTQQAQARAAALADQLISAPPQGALSFADWKTQTRKAERSAPELGLPATKRTEAGLRQGYLAYLNSLRTEASEQVSPSALEQAGQQELPLEPALNAPVVRPSEPERTVAPVTAMELAMREATTKARRRADETRAEYELRTKRALELEELAKTAEIARRVEAANRQADDALAGRINGNTPVAVSDLVEFWKRAATDAGIDVGALRGQARGRVQQAIARAKGKTLWVQQLNALRSARDAMTENTVSRDSMDALIVRLENFSGQGKSPTVVQEVQGQGFEDARVEAEARAAQAEQQATVTESANAPNARVEPQGGVVQYQEGGSGRQASKAGRGDSVKQRAARNAAANAEAAQVTSNAAPVAEARLAVPPPALGGERSGAAPVAYSEGGGLVAGGEPISYSDAALQAAKARVSVPEPASFTKARTTVEVPRAEQRTLPADASRATKQAFELEGKYTFEQYHYMPDNEHGAVNAAWLQDFDRAMRGLPPAANMNAGETGVQEKKTQASVRNAKAALRWLQEYEGQDIIERAKERFALLQREQTRNNAMRNAAQREIMRMQDALNEELKQERLVAEARKRAQDIIEDKFDASGSPYNPSDALRAVVRNGQVDNVLQFLENAGSTPWVQQAATFLRSLKLSTSITYGNKNQKVTSYGPSLGYYDAKVDAVEIHTGGENEHVVVHELTHAATAGRLLRAQAARRVAPSRRTLEEKRLVADLAAVEQLVRELEQLSGAAAHKQAFKNTQEFVAEVFSNEQFQSWLQAVPYKGSTGWRATWNWVKRALGFGMDNTALERAMAVSMPFFTNDRYATAATVGFDYGPQGAMGAADSVTSTLVAKWQQLAQNHKLLGNAGAQTRATLLAMSTTHNIQQWIGKSPQLRKLVPGMQAFAAADSLKTIMLRDIGTEMSSVSKRIELALSKLSFAQQTAMNQKLAEFAGEMSRYNIDLNKNYEQNRQSKKDLDPAAKGEIDRLHAEYRQLDPELRIAVEDAIRLFRKGYTRHTALMLQTVLRSYGKDHSAYVNPLIARLDILDPKLNDATAFDPAYYPDAYTANLDRRIRALVQEVRQQQGGGGRTGTHLGADVAQVAEVYNASVANPYTPLGRYGDYFIGFTVGESPEAWKAAQQALAPFGKVIGAPSKNRHIFMRFENSAQRDAALQAVTGLGANAQEIERGSTFESLSALRMQGIPMFARKLLRAVDESFTSDVTAEVRQFMKRQILDYLPESSAQKALTPRKGGGVPGYEANFLRNYTVRAQGVASMVANSYTMPEFDKAFASMKTEIEDLRSTGGDATAADQSNAIFSEISKRFANSLHPVESPMVDKVKAFGYNYYLAVSPAFWLTNLMQPYQLTLPVLGGRYGFVASAKAMGRATGKALRIVEATLRAGATEGNKVGGIKGAVLGVLDMKPLLDSAKLSTGEREFVQRLLAAGQLDVTQGQEQGHLATDSPRWQATTTKLLSLGSHYTEVVNRLTAGLAAYNLEMTRGQDTERAIQRGILTVRDTQYDYSDRNIASALGRHGVAGKVTPLLASFQQYAFQTTELLLRLVRDATFRVPEGATAAEIAQFKEDRVAAQKALAGIAGTTSVLAGTLGLPMANVLAWAVNAALGGDDDPADVKVAYRGWLADVFGVEVAEAIARGVPRAVLGFDMSTRAGMQDLLPGSRFITDRRPLQSMLDAGAFDLLGPAVSAGRDVSVGLSHVADGRVMDGLTELLPLALRGPVKAVKIGTTGYTTSTGNKLPLEVTPWAQFVQTVGFTPSVKAEQSEANFAFRQRDALLKQTKAKLTQEFYNTLESGEDTSAILQRMQEFSAKNPAYAIQPAAGLRGRAKERAVAGEASGIATLPQYLPILERYSFANTR